MAYMKSNSEESIKNVVIYTRVSSAEQVEGYSLETQKDDLKKFITYKGYNLVEEFIDRGISAKDIENRTDYKRMMKFISEKSKSKNKIDAIIVWKLSRFSRNSLDLQQALSQLEKYDCHLIAEKDGLNTFNDMNKVILKLLGIFAELERTNIANNVRSGMRKGAEDGQWMGGVAPYGYKTVQKNQSGDSTLSINNEEAILVRKIFNLYAEGNGYAKIADLLNNRWLLKTRRNSLWSYTSIAQMLDNPTYIGMIRYGKHTDWSKLGRKGKSSPENILLIDGKHEAIIDLDTWNKVRELRTLKGFKHPKSRKTEHLLSGKILCPMCGTPMVSTVSSKKRDDGTIRNNFYYQCGRYNNTKSCKPNLVRKDLVDTQAKNLLFEFSKNPNLQELILNKLNKSLDLTEENNTIEHAVKELKTLESKIDRAYVLLLEEDVSNTVSKEKIKAMIVSLENNVAHIKQTISLAEDRIFLKKNEAKVSEDICKLLSNLEAYFDQASYEKQRNVMDYLIKEITIFNDPDIKKRSTINNITLQFSSEEIAQFNFDTRNNVWFTYDKAPPY